MRKKNNTEKHFELVIGPLCGFIRMIAYKYLFDKTMTDDVAQEVLIGAWKHFDRLPRSEERLKGWLYTVTKRQAYSVGRELKRRNAGLDRSVEIDIFGVRYDAGRAKRLAVCEPANLADPFVVADVKSFLFDLPSTHRDVLLLSIAGCNYAQMAQVTSSSLGTVRSRLHYARKKAKRALACHR